MKPEEEARQQIDQLLTAAGWTVQDYRAVNLGAGLGVAIREFPTGAGPADYLLVVEAKKAGTTLSGVSEQSVKYMTSTLAHIPRVANPLPFGYESTGVETYFRDERDPDPRSRRVFSFHRPETLLDWTRQDATLRAHLTQMPALIAEGLRACQVEAITNLETSFAQGRPTALIQMATGSGKTFMAVSAVYRLIKFAGARRVLFLVDRRTLGKQAYNEFQQYVTPDDGRKFTELYNVQHLQSNKLDPVSKVCITTIQRLYSMLRGEPELETEAEEVSLFDLPLDLPPREVAYSPTVPIETFDFIITDECHRSIYNVWRQVLEYFDSFIIGLTATPSKQTFGFFNQNLVMEYSHERAVADGVNVGFEVYRIQTEITEKGGIVEAGFYVDKRDKLTRQVRWEQLDDDLAYTPNQLDRDVVAPDQIRTVIRAFRDRLFEEIFPGRTDVPKTLIFAKDDSHAEDIVHIVREEFGKGNEFCKKITYRSTEKTDDLIASFRNSYNPRIAVTVDMISTGTDIKPLECLLFMRNVASRVYFDQMKGRGTRTISETDLRAVTADARRKTHFVIVDAIGVCERVKSDAQPLERVRHVSFEKLLQAIALGDRQEDNLSSLAGRLARLEQGISPADRQQIEERAGQPLPAMIHELLNAIDPDVRIERAQEMFGVGDPTEAQVAQATTELAQAACQPFNDVPLRDLLIDVHRKNEQTMDITTQDRVLVAGFDAGAKEKARAVVETFRQFIQDNRDELTALQFFYSRPYGQRTLTYEAVKDLAEAIQKPPYSLSTERVWAAYEQLEAAKVHRAGPGRLLTDIISLVRFALGESQELAPFAELVDVRFRRWLAEQESAGRSFTAEQRAWLEMIKAHIATSMAITMDDFEYAPFHEQGGPVRVYQLFGPTLNDVLTELNEALAA